MRYPANRNGVKCKKGAGPCRKKRHAKATLKRRRQIVSKMRGHQLRPDLPRVGGELSAIKDIRQRRIGAYVAETIAERKDHRTRIYRWRGSL